MTKLLKHKDIIQATQFCPGMNEIDFINSCLKGSQVFRVRIPEGVFVPVDIDNFAQNRGLTRNKAYHAILDILERIVDKGEGFMKISLNKNTVWHTNLIYDYKTDEMNNSISIQYNTKALEKVSGTMIPGTFTYVDSRMGAVSSKKRYLLYELLETQRYKEKFTLTVQQIREACKIQDYEYSEFRDLQRRLIRPTLADIKNKLGITIEYNKKRGTDKIDFQVTETPKVSIHAAKDISISKEEYEEYRKLKKEEHQRKIYEGRVLDNE